MSASSSSSRVPEERLEFNSADPEPITLVATAFGSRSDPLIVFMHGGGQTRHTWDRTCRHLAARGFYCVTMDARGHGESDWDPHAKYSSLYRVLDLKASLRQLGHPQKPILVGASMGGTTAMFVGHEVARACVFVDIGAKVEVSGTKRIMTFMNEARDTGFASIEEAENAVARYQPHRKYKTNKNTKRDRTKKSGLEKNLRFRNGRYYWHWDPRSFGPARYGAKIDWNLHNQWREAEQLARMTALSKLTPEIPCLLIRGRSSDILSEEGAQHFLKTVTHCEFVDVDAHHMIVGDSNDVFTTSLVAWLEQHNLHRAAPSPSSPSSSSSIQYSSAASGLSEAERHMRQHEERMQAFIDKAALADRSKL